MILPPGVSETEYRIMLQARIAAKEELLRAARSFGLPFYNPHAKQAQFHASMAKYRAVFAGNRFGKSQCGVAEDCAWVIGERSWLPKEDPLRTAGIPQRANKGLIICADWDKAEEIFTCESTDPHLQGKVWKNIPRSFVKHLGRNSSGKIDRIEFKNGSILAFDTVKSFLNNPMGSESSDWDFIHVDEPIPEAMWKAVSRGLIDRNGRGWFTLTNLSQPWIYDLFFPSQTRVAGRKEVARYSKDGGLSHWAIVGSIYDNPYLSKAAIESYEQSLTPDERQCRLHGLAMHLSGLVYKSFDTGRHILTDLPSYWKSESFSRPPMDWTCHYAIDTHPRTPHEVLFCWVNPNKQLFFLAEIFETGLIAEIAQRILDITDGYTMGLQLCEPAAWIPSPVDGKCMADVFIDDFNLMVEPAPKDLKSGILAVNAALSAKDFCFFAPDLPNFFGEIMKYGWNPKMVGKDKPRDENDHAMECLYRLIVSNPTYIDLDAQRFEVPEVNINNADLSDIHSDNFAAI